MQCLGIILLCVFPLIKLAVDLTACVITTRRERIAFYCGIAIPQGTLIILQLYLCDRPIEIGFCQVGLETNDLIKILNRKNIILKIQSVPPDRSDTIGVELCFCRNNEQRQQSQNYYVSINFQLSTFNFQLLSFIFPLYSHPSLGSNQTGISKSSSCE